MKKIAAIVALGLAGSACLVPADDLGDPAPDEQESVAETSDALSKRPAPDGQATDWINDNIPQWSVYIGGRGRDLHPGRDPWSSFTSVYYEDPQDSDVFAPVILVRRGDEKDPTRWIQLSLTQHWLKGSRYFDELVDCGALTLLDIVVVLGELAQYVDSYIQPSPVHVLEAATPDALRDLRNRSRTTCKDRKAFPLRAFMGLEGAPYGPPSPPSWAEGPDAHMSGPGPAGSGDGRRLPPDVTSTQPSLSQVPPASSPPRTAAQNGVAPDDPPAKPSPYDRGYKPRSGEVKETFKCNGEVFYGYRAGCLDLSNVSVSMKWFVQGGMWLQSVPERIVALRTKFQDAVIKNGSREDCERHCRYLGYAQFAVVTAIIPTVCVLVTKSPACANAAGTNVATQIGTVVVANGALSTVLQGEATAECVKHVCDGK